MSARFFPTLKKWPLAVSEALSLLEGSPLRGEVSEISFDIGPPSEGRLPLGLVVDGRKIFLGKLTDLHPFLRHLREWMERCLVHDKEGTLHPETVTLDCADCVLSLLLIHVGWEDSPRAEPVSLLIAVRSDRRSPVYCGFCRTFDVIVNLYSSLTGCLKKYRKRFDSPEFWFDVKRFDGLDERSTTDRMLEEIMSNRLNRVILTRRKKE